MASIPGGRVRLRRAMNDRFGHAKGPAMFGILPIDATMRRSRNQKRPLTFSQLLNEIAIVSKLRVFKRVGSFSGEDRQKVGEAIRIQLDLKN
jgi:hypothetical protein